MARVIGTMHVVRALLCAGCVVLFLASPALAATAPVLVAPDDNASVSTGDSVTFSWNGSLQGDSNALARSYFRIEMLEHTQASWSDATYVLTDAGASSTRIAMAAPAEGAYRWRVCAYGVVDESSSLVIEQIACSSSNALTTVATSVQRTSSSNSLQVDRTTVVRKPNQTIVRQRPSGTSQAPITVTAPARTQVQERVEFASDDTSKANQETVSKRALKAAATDAGVTHGEGGGAGAVISDGLNATLPGVPVPFWSLLLLLVAMPMTWAWRTSLVAMFEWDDEASAMHEVPVTVDDDIAA